METTQNTLFCGDNLDILRKRDYFADNSIDLIYLDPPFNSKATYNILFAEKNGKASAAQIKAFEDTWQWDIKAEETYREIVEQCHNKKVADLIMGFRKFLSSNDMMAYLTNMCIRLVELRRVLKNTGSIYLHCDPTASHYLKLVMDAIFGVKNFQNEIVWCYEIGGRVSKWAYGRRHDVLLFYTKSENFIFNWDKILRDWTEEGASKFKYEDEKGKYRLMGRYLKGSPIKGHRDINPEWEKNHPNLVYRHYMKKGRMCLDYWNIPPINQASKERLGYPTQKPEALLELIIKASSNEGDIILDPFCGCGTTIVVAEKLKRKWIGIDITHLAISLMRHRLENTFDYEMEYKVIGEPTDLRGAEALKEEDPHQFEWWALGLVGAHPTESEKKKGADKGIDGYIYFYDDPKMIKTKAIIIQVKSGHINPAQIRDLRGVIEREKAQIGVFITLKNPTRPMENEAASAGYYKSPSGHNYIKIQLLTIEELLEGKKIDYPSKATGIDVTFKKPKKYHRKEKQDNLFNQQK